MAGQTQRLHDQIAKVLDGRVDGYNLATAAFGDGLAFSAATKTAPKVLASTLADTNAKAYIRKKGTAFQADAAKPGIEVVVDPTDTNGHFCVVDKDNLSTGQKFRVKIDDGTSSPGATVSTPKGAFTIDTGGAFNVLIKRNGTTQFTLDGTTVTAAVKVVSTQLESTVATGTAPFVVASTTKVTNLNADQVDGASASATPTASTIPIADGAGKLVSGWGGSASTLATLNSSSKVVEDPANATATPTASKIPIADGSGDLADGWLTSNVPLKDGTNDFTALNSVKAGSAASQQATLGGPILNTLSQAANVDAAATNLHTHTIQANTLGANGDSLEFYAAGTMTNSVNAKEVRWQYGGTTIATLTLPTSTTGSWVIRGSIVRTGAATQKVTFEGAYSAASGLAAYKAMTKDLTTALDLIVVGKGGASNEVFCEISKVWWEPGAPA